MIKQILRALPLLLICSLLFTNAKAQRPNGFQKVVPQKAGRVDSLEDFIQMIGSDEIITGGRVLEVKYKRALHLSMNGKKYKRSEVFAFQNRKGYFRRFAIGERRGKTRYTETLLQRIKKHGNIDEYKNVLPDESANDPMRGRGGSSLMQYTYYRWFHILSTDNFGPSKSRKFLKVMMKDCPACIKKVNASRTKALRLFFKEN